MTASRNNGLMPFSRDLMCIVLLLTLASCGSELLLESRSAAVPAGVDFTGYWQLRKDPDAKPVPVNVNGDEPPIIISSDRRQHRSQRRRSSSGTSAQVFLELGESLKITQTDFGIFISYDRSVVEEFTFGENRIINIGPIEAKRVAGWEADAFVVETLDDTGTILFEAWRLEESDAVLIRDPPSWHLLAI